MSLKSRRTRPEGSLSAIANCCWSRSISQCSGHSLPPLQSCQFEHRDFDAAMKLVGLHPRFLVMGSRFTVFKCKNSATTLVFASQLIGSNSSPLQPPHFLVARGLTELHLTQSFLCDPQRLRCCSRRGIVISTMDSMLTRILDRSRRTAAVP